MQVKKIGRQALFYWRMRLTLYFLIPAFLSGVFIGFYKNIIWQILTGLWLLVYLFFFLLYYPIKRRRLYYRLDEKKFSVYGGVVYWRIRSIPTGNIQTVQMLDSPLLHICGLRSFIVNGAGISIHLPCLTAADASALYTELTGDCLEDEMPFKEGGQDA